MYQLVIIMIILIESSSSWRSPGYILATKPSRGLGRSPNRLGPPLATPLVVQFFSQGKFLFGAFWVSQPRLTSQCIFMLEEFVTFQNHNEQPNLEAQGQKENQRNHYCQGDEPRVGLQVLGVPGLGIDQGRVLVVPIGPSP